MKKIRFGIGGILMLSAMMISDNACVFAVYLCAAFLHEMGHILAAKLLKVEIEEIKFDFSGARICTHGQLSYFEEFFLAAAGPMSNLLAFSASLIVSQAKKIPTEQLFEGAERFLSETDLSAVGILGFFALSSMIQAASNLLPVSSFDGGRILYCAVAVLISENAARAVLTATTAVSAFLLWTVALYLMLRISSGLGIFVFASCIFTATVMKRE